MRARTPVGEHTVIDMDAERPLGHDPDVERALRLAAARAGATVLELAVRHFEPFGTSGIALLAESHISIHTWPERRVLAADVFTCSTDVDVPAVLAVLEEVFRPTSQTVRRLRRGPASGASWNDWFEEDEPGAPGVTGYPVDRVLERVRSEHQDIEVFDAPVLGRTLALDGIVQVADVDAHAYHEVLVHPALHAHRSPRRVAVVGGGDGCAIAEVLKHSCVERVDLLELDPLVCRVAEDHLPAGGALRDERVHGVFGDAMVGLAALEVGRPVDVLITDMTDPVGQAARFFTEAYVGRAASLLGDDGVLVLQSESLHFHPAVVRSACRAARRHFRFVEVLWTALATYPGGWWTFVIAAKHDDPRVVRRATTVETRLYDCRDHEWFFLPEHVRARLGLTDA